MTCKGRAAHSVTAFRGPTAQEMVRTFRQPRVHFELTVLRNSRDCDRRRQQGELREKITMRNCGTIGIVAARHDVSISIDGIVPT
jgi:hypothetical protein